MAIVCGCGNSSCRNLADETRRLEIGVRHFSYRDQQVEQDRAPLVLGHHAELARQATGQSRSGGEPDRSHDHRYRTQGQKQAWTPTSTPLDAAFPPDAELSAIHIRRDVFHGDWNYTNSSHPIGTAIESGPLISLRALRSTANTRYRAPPAAGPGGRPARTSETRSSRSARRPEAGPRTR